jgi:hypothetical protein
MSPLLKLVLQASSQLWYPLVTMGFNTELNPLGHIPRNSPKCWETEKIKMQMSLVLVLMFQASSQLWNPLIIEGSNTEFNP